MKVLVIEANKTQAEQASKELKSRGCEIFLADNFVDADKVLRANLIDMIMSSTNIPREKNGEISKYAEAMLCDIILSRKRFCQMSFAVMGPNTSDAIKYLRNRDPRTNLEESRPFRLHKIFVWTEEGPLKPWGEIFDYLTQK